MLSSQCIVCSVHTLPPLRTALGERGVAGCFPEQCFQPLKTLSPGPSIQCRRSTGEGGVAGCCFVKVTRPLQQKDLKHPLCHFFSWDEEVS